MAKRKLQIRLHTDSDEGFYFTLVSCSKGILGGIYFIEKEDCSGFAYHINTYNGWWCEETFKKEIDAVRYLVQHSFLMNWHYDLLYIKLCDYWNSEIGAISMDEIENLNLAM